ncbi:MAG: FAD-binding protein [Armatimonadetes bacterium]|nr:FAD-binding protein [Armatimonadota bacterium]
MSKLLGLAFNPSDVAGIASVASALGLPFDVVQLVGAPVTDSGAGTVHHAGLNDVPQADAVVAAVRSIAGDGYSHVAAVSSMASKDVLARLAGALDYAMVTDVAAIESTSVFIRPILAGTVLEKVEVLTGPVVFTFRPSGFSAAPAGGSSAIVSLTIGPSKAEIVQLAKPSGSRPDLTQAKIVVSGGRPLKDADTFESVIGGLADALGGAAGATRAAVDSGIAPNELQVGQTGKIVAPDLYIAAGISGSTQHMAGIKDSKLIVAINKDGDAPIFEAADLGLVADLFVAIPELRSVLGK